MWYVPGVRTVIWSALVLWTAAGVCAGGAYQRTKDGKTIVWNEHPRTGDVATWSGRRDANDYGNGFGTLTWYRTQEKGRAESKQTLYAYYFGNMVRGKFNGPVNSHSRGVTSHAVFNEGKVIGRWAAGPVKSWAMGLSNVESVRPERSDTSVAVQRHSENPGASVENVQAKPETRDATPEAGMSKPSNAQVAEFHPAPKSYAAMPSERPRPSYEAVHEEAKSAPTVDVPGEGPRPGEPRSNDGNAKLEVDSSLRALTGPPPALNKSESGGSDPSTSVSSKQDHLSKTDVVNLSDSEARKRGYDLSRYDRPDPQFDPLDNTWSLSYASKTTGAGAPSPKRFTVAIDDKTKRTAIVPAR